jgi:hypothetical protein
LVTADGTRASIGMAALQSVAYKNKRAINRAREIGIKVCALWANKATLLPIYSVT